LTLTINTTNIQREREPVTWDEDTDDETMVYTPTSSAYASSDEAIVTPTSSTATVTAVATPTDGPSFPATFDEQSNSSINNNEASSSERPDNFQGFAESDASEENEWDSLTPLLFDLSVVEGIAFHEPSNSSINSNEPSTSLISSDFQTFPEIDAVEEDDLASITAVFNLPIAEEGRSFSSSQEELKWLNWDYESREEREAFEKAMEISRGPQVDYLPMNVEQHRIMSAYVENMTSKRGFHTKEDDKFFAELLDDQIEPDDDELDGGDDISED
jgi:hypothetical protein